ncbi:MAG: molybdenum ABC transporter ATP-binding protein [Gammaproteobacteria bacterium]|nr:molybdenum ABC transporter ATP-binding protein [Gammaproteobacteria bacterium]
MIAANIQLQKPGFELRAEFEVPAGGVTGVFGPSGSGKTTLLRALAGLEAGVTGNLVVSGAHWLSGSHSMSVQERLVGFVFQDPCLFPHLSVMGNLLYARNRAKNSSYQIDLEHVCEMLNIHDLLNRNAGLLSGGERQRVAIGRALLNRPAMLLLDEPLSAVDQGGRNYLISILENLFQNIEIPIFYVSHASDEIARLAENLILMNQGRVIAHGELKQVLGKIDTPLNASDEAFSVMRCTIKSHQLAYLTTVQTAGGEVLQVPRQPLEGDSVVRLRIRARDVSLSLQRAQESSILNILPATVVALSPEIEQGTRTVKLDVAGDSLLARVSEYSVQQLQLQPGKAVFAQVKSISLVG